MCVTREMNMCVVSSSYHVFKGSSLPVGEGGAPVGQ